MKRLISPLVTIAFFASIVAVIVLFVVPALQSIVDIHAETITEHTRLERRYQNSLARSRAQRELAVIEQTVSAIRDHVPLERDALTFVRSIEDIAANHRLETRIAIDRSALRPADGHHVVTTPVTIEYSGPYPALIASLRDIERLPLPLAVAHLIISADSSGTPAKTEPHTKLIISTRTIWRTTPSGS